MTNPAPPPSAKMQKKRNLLKIYFPKIPDKIRLYCIILDNYLTCRQMVYNAWFIYQNDVKITIIIVIKEKMQ